MPVPAVDPITLAVQTGAKVIGVVWPAGKAAWNTHEAHQAIGEVVPKALALAICPDNPEHATAQRAAELVHERLRHTDILEESGRQPGRLKRAWNWSRSLVGSERAPKAALYGETEFLFLLWQWLRDALKDPDEYVTAALAEVTCRDPALHADPSAEVLAVYFPAAFVHVIRHSHGSKWRTDLLDSLIQAEENRQALKEFLGWTDVFFAPAAGAAVGAVASVSGAGDLVSVAAGLGTLGIVIPTQLRAVWTAGNRQTGEDLGIRKRVVTWLDDCGVLLMRREDDSVTPPTAGWVARLRDSGDQMRVPDALLQHLGLLAAEAERHGELDLASYVRDAQHAVQRVQYNAGESARNEALDALERLSEYLLPLRNADFNAD